MTTPNADPTRRPQPLILIRGFGGMGVEDEKRVAYQGFNDGTVYPQKRGENYIYEGLVLRFMKSRWQYHDATNVVGYYGESVTNVPQIPAALNNFDSQFFSGDQIVIDPAMALSLVETTRDPLSTMWVFRYYDLSDRDFDLYGRALVKLIDFVRALAVAKQGGEPPKVNIIAHSMGGLVVREAVQCSYPKEGREAKAYINKIVTLGTPHRGISFQVIKNWIRIEAEKELERFNPEYQNTATHQDAYVNFARHFPPERLLCVVGTNYRTYGPVAASWLNRVFSAPGEFGPTYNRSDGLVKQISAQMPGSPRTFVHKCHGGPDSLVTSREAFEIATRFFFGNLRVRISLVSADVKRGLDFFGKSEMFFGVSIKPRRLDFDLFHQSAEAENCYGPFHKTDFSDASPTFGWAGSDRLIWEGWLDTTARAPATDRVDKSDDIVMRLDFYVGERDTFGVGFSDNVIFRKQYYARAVFNSLEELKLRRMELYTSEGFAGSRADIKDAKELEGYQEMKVVKGGWEFDVGGTGFQAKLRVAVDLVPLVGP
jgi:hypothetical protein